MSETSLQAAPQERVCSSRSKQPGTPPAWRILTVNTLAFAACFAVWLLYGALIKFLTQIGVAAFTTAEVGVLIAAPILTGSLLRLPVGLLTDRFGGRPIYAAVMLVSAGGLLLVSGADTFAGFLTAGLCFGVAGSAFAVGVAYTSVWFEKARQGTALGIFGTGNAGAAITLLLAPKMLDALTAGGAEPEGWRRLPLIYAAALLVVTLLFWLTTENRVAAASSYNTLRQRLAPLKNPRVWRFGLYYFLVFGAFVGLSSWLVLYYVDVYDCSLATAGILAALFSMPSSIVRAGGGWLSDQVGARSVMYCVLGTCLAGSLVLCLPLGLWAFAAVVSIVGIAMGVGMAAVYKHIPVYFPSEVGVVGGIVGVIGGLGGFVCPLVFGGLLTATASRIYPDGVWITAWIFLAGVSAAALSWMHLAVKRITARSATRVGSMPAAATQ